MVDKYELLNVTLFHHRSFVLAAHWDLPFLYISCLFHCSFIAECARLAIKSDLLLSIRVTFSFLVCNVDDFNWSSVSICFWRFVISSSRLDSTVRTSPYYFILRLEENEYTQTSLQRADRPTINQPMDIAEYLEFSCNPKNTTTIREKISSPSDIKPKY